MSVEDKQSDIMSEFDELIEQVHDLVVRQSFVDRMEVENGAFCELYEQEEDLYHNDPNYNESDGNEVLNRALNHMSSVIDDLKQYLNTPQSEC